MSMQEWWQRLPFTRQEAAVILFLLVSLLVGGGVSLFRGHRPDATCPAPEDVTEAPRDSRPEIDEMVERTTSSSSAGRRATLEGKININTASATELQLLPRVGPSLSQRIVVYREAHGGFTSVEELMEVKGIGEKTFQRIRDHITVK